MDHRITPSRRALIAAPALAATVPAAAFAQAKLPGMTHVFDLGVRVGPAQELGEFAGGRRRVIPIIGGDITGEGIKGEVLPGGADWQSLRADGVTQLVARYTLRMESGETVGVVNTGVRRASSEVARRMAAGELVDPSQYYFRATPVFETGPGRFGWLTESVFLSVGERLPDLVRLKVYRID